VPSQKVPFCIEQGLLIRSEVARTTFYRLINQFALLKPVLESSNKARLAFSKAHANEMWQADTLDGPHVTIDGSPVQTFPMESMIWPAMRAG
jgi:hypothetical protein